MSAATRSTSTQRRPGASDILRPQPVRAGARSPDGRAAAVVRTALAPAPPAHRDLAPTRVAMVDQAAGSNPEANTQTDPGIDAIIQTEYPSTLGMTQLVQMAVTGILGYKTALYMTGHERAPSRKSLLMGTSAFVTTLAIRNLMPQRMYEFLKRSEMFVTAPLYKFLKDHNISKDSIKASIQANGPAIGQFMSDHKIVSFVLAPLSIFAIGGIFCIKIRGK